MACLRAEVSEFCDRSEYVLLQKDTYRPSLHCIQVLWKEQQQAHGTTKIVHGRFPSSPCKMYLLPSGLGQVHKCKFHAMLDDMHVNSVAVHWCKRYQQQPVRSELLLLVMGTFKSASLTVEKRALALWNGMKWTRCSSEVNRKWKKQERNGKDEKGKCRIATSLYTKILIPNGSDQASGAAGLVTHLHHVTILQDERGLRDNINRHWCRMKYFRIYS